MWKKMKRNMEWLVIVALLVGAVVAVGCGDDKPIINTRHLRADAGPDRTGQLGGAVTLSAVNVSTPVGSTLYSWKFLEVPVGSSVSEANLRKLDGSYYAGSQSYNDSGSVYFAPDMLGKYIIQLGVASDGYDYDDIVITVIPNTGGTNTPPVANAGTAKTGISIGSQVLLSGTATDVDTSDVLVYKWTLSNPPASITSVPPMLYGADTPAPYFTPDVEGTYTATLIVNDGKVDSAPSRVAIGVDASVVPSNMAPVANAGTAQSGISIGTQVMLSGSGSDADNDSLIYKWTLANPPTSINTATPILSGADTPAPYFTPVESGTYTATLIVNDTKVDSASSTVTITVDPPVVPSNYVTDLQNALANNSFLVALNNDFLEVLEFGPVGGNMTFTYMMPSWYPSHYGNMSIYRTGTWTVADAGGFAQATENAKPRTLNTAAPVDSANTLLMTGYRADSGTSSVDIATWIKTATLSNATLSGHKLSAYVDVYTLSYQFNADGTGVHVEDVYSHPFTWAIDASSRKVVVTFTGVFTDRNGVVNSKHNLFMTERHKADVGKREFGVVKFGNSNTIIGGIMLLWDWL